MFLRISGGEADTFSNNKGDPARRAGDAPQEAEHGGVAQAHPQPRIDAERIRSAAALLATLGPYRKGGLFRNVSSLPEETNRHTFGCTRTSNHSREKRNVVSTDHPIDMTEVQANGDAAREARQSMRSARLRLVRAVRHLLPSRVWKRQADWPTIRKLPIIALVPDQSVWFVRMALAFLDHLNRGGQITDQLTGRVVGDPSGLPFNYDHVRGGPLFWLPSLLGTKHLFIGHTVCPGFADIAHRFPWWNQVRFSARGYDYLHEGLDYARTPVDLAPHPYACVDVDAIERAAWTSPQRTAFIYGDPIELAIRRYLRSGSNRQPGCRDSKHIQLTDGRFHDYLIGDALPSYAKYFLSYQAMTIATPGSVRLFSAADLRARSAATLAAILSYMADTVPPASMVLEAVHLARREHLFAVQLTLGHSFDFAQRLSRDQLDEDLRLESLDRRIEPALRAEVCDRLSAFGVDARCFVEAGEKSKAG